MANTPKNIRILQRKLYLRSKQKENQRFYSLYDKLYRSDILIEAYKRCKANKGGAGVDGVTFEMLETDEAWKGLLMEIGNELKSKTYKAQPVKRVEIPKENGKTRCLGVPTIKDRIVQMAMSIVMQPIFEPHLHTHSYGYRPRRSAAQAVKRIETCLKQGHQHVMDADLTGYFDNIPHDRLMKKVAKRISDGSFLRLLKGFIEAPYSVQTGEGKRKIVANNKGLGTPQGGVISPVLANIYLNDFCRLIHKKTPCQIVTYADDFVILHRKAFTDVQKEWINKVLMAEGLMLNQSKTHCVDMTQLRSEFNFLGFNFKRSPCLFNRRRSYFHIQPSKKSQNKLKDALREILKRGNPQTLEILINRVNRVIQGWKNYFDKVGYPKRVFRKIDWYINDKFYRWSRSRSQRRSRYLTQGSRSILRKKGLIRVNS